MKREFGQIITVFRCKQLIMLSAVVSLHFSFAFVVFCYSENTTVMDSPFTITQDVAKEIVAAVSGLLLLVVNLHSSVLFMCAEDCLKAACCL